MSIRIRFPATLAERIGGLAVIEIEGRTIRECLRAVTARHPELARMIWLDSDELNGAMLVFHRNERVPHHDLDRRLKPTDELDIVPAIEAG